MVKAHFLKKAVIFRHMDKRDLKRAFSIAKTARYKAGETIFSKDEAGSSFFIVTSGKVKIFTSTQPNRTKTMAYLGEGDFFGEMSLLGGQTRSASAAAEEDCRLLVITRQNFNRLLRSDHDFTLRLLLTLCERLRNANEEIEALLFRNVLGRLAVSIVKLCDETRAARPPITIRMNIKELAEYVGTTREPLSRALAALKRGKMLEYRDQTITVTNLDKLRALSPL